MLLALNVDDDDDDDDDDGDDDDDNNDDVTVQKLRASAGLPSL